MFLHLKDFIFFSLAFWLKLNKVPFINWTHGLNLGDANNELKNSVFRLLHNLSDAIVLYSPNEKKYIRQKNHEKCFVAANTLNFNTFTDISETKEEIKKSYNIPFEKIVLFVGRIQPRKRLDDLLEVFSTNTENVGLVIVGPGLTPKQKKVIEHSDSIHYLGAIYDNYEINRIHKMSDIFCIPGANGLGLNLAMYWGLPCITYKNIPHGPEIWYLKDSYNGYALENDNSEALKTAIFDLLSHHETLREMSENARRFIIKEGNINNMFSGFINAVNFLKVKMGKKKKFS
ncbi:MAG: glycosyltransferase family 4 protein [Bacteroidales bacterium]|nr:glycosyltransferase family 4 protein [Bacteroidales bacterium]